MASPSRPVSLITLYAVSLPIYGVGHRETITFPSKATAKRKFRETRDGLKALAKRIKSYPKGSAPGEPPPEQPVFGDVRLFERKYEKGKLREMLALSENREFSPVEESELDSHLYQSPNTKPVAAPADPEPAD